MSNGTDNSLVLEDYSWILKRLFHLIFQPVPLTIYKNLTVLILNSNDVLMSFFLSPAPPPSSIFSYSSVLPWSVVCNIFAPGFCPNLPSRMTMHTRMAIRAPVLRPAEDRNASPWHARILPWLWHGHTRSVRVLVPLSDGSPPSQTTMGNSYRSWVRRLKCWRLVMMLAVLSKMIKKKDTDTYY